MKSYGILGVRGGIPPLSGWVSTIPGECWAQPGFKDCNAIQYQLAKAFCQGISQDNDTCIGQHADQNTLQACKCTRAKAPAPTTTTTKRPVVTSSSVPADEAFGPPPGIFGMDPKTLLMVGAVGVGLYIFLGQKPKKGSA
jgi:hypothetical protein